jgi:pimeloyl-ACP methyl ester carboxylesterase
MIKRNKLIVLVLLVVFLFNFQYLESIFISEFVDVDDTIGTVDTPLILIHGYNPIYSKRISEFSFFQMQNELSEDLNYVDKGILTSQTTCAELRKGPIVIRATYLDSLSTGNRAFEIESYSSNLNEIIKRILECTEAKKVDIVSHSMGGLVSRYYINNIDNTSIRKLIMIATPNSGGIYNAGELANLAFKRDTKEYYRFVIDFIQLVDKEGFIEKLNSNFNSNVEYYTIAGKSSSQGDGLVEIDTVALDYARNEVVECGHSRIKNPKSCPKAYTYVKEFLES